MSVKLLATAPMCPDEYGLAGILDCPRRYTLNNVVVIVE